MSEKHFSADPVHNNTLLYLRAWTSVWPQAPHTTRLQILDLKAGTECLARFIIMVSYDMFWFQSNVARLIQYLASYCIIANV